jgi:hypothetical protein
MSRCDLRGVLWIQNFYSGVEDSAQPEPALHSDGFLRQLATTTLLRSARRNSHRQAPAFSLLAGSNLRDMPG